MKVGAKRLVLVWRVIAVAEDGRGLGSCGHDHAQEMDAVRCPWEPTPWPERCDLLVRRLRDRSTDKPRTKRRRRHAAPIGGAL